jgi:hypothetical protein
VGTSPRVNPCERVATGSPSPTFTCPVAQVACSWHHATAGSSPPPDTSLRSLICAPKMSIGAAPLTVQGKPAAMSFLYMATEALAGRPRLDVADLGMHGLHPPTAPRRHPALPIRLLYDPQWQRAPHPTTLGRPRDADLVPTCQLARRRDSQPAFGRVPRAATAVTEPVGQGRPGVVQLQLLTGVDREGRPLLEAISRATNFITGIVNNYATLDGSRRQKFIEYST